METFLDTYDFGARTLYPLRLGDGNDEASLLAALSQHQPGGPAGSRPSSSPPETEEAAITQWAQSCPCAMGPCPGRGYGKHRGHRPGDAPRPAGPLPLGGGQRPHAVTEYTVNNGGYSDDPDFRPLLNHLPGARGDGGERGGAHLPAGLPVSATTSRRGVAVAQALSARGYQSFVVDYRLRPYTQQEGALDLAGRCGLSGPTQRTTALTRRTSR